MPPLDIKVLKRSPHASLEELYRDKRLKPLQRMMLADLLELFEAARKALGSPLSITSGKRTPEGQEELIQKGYRAAKHSTHVYGAAIDILVPGWATDTAIAELFLTAANQRGQMLPRVGMHTYRRAFGVKSAPFVHIDIMPQIVAAIGAGAQMPKHFPDLPSEIPPAWRIEGLVF